MGKLKDFIGAKSGLVFYALLLTTIAVFDPYKANKSHMLFYAVTVGITIFLVFLKKLEGTKYTKYSMICIVSVMTFFLTIIGARHHFLSDVIFFNIVHGEATTLIERASDASDSGVLDSTFTIYYFKNKEIICCDDATQKKIKDNLTDKYYSGSFYNYTILLDESIEKDNRIIEYGLTLPRYTDNYGNVYVVDDGIRSHSIVCISNEDHLFYCSKELYLLSSMAGVNTGEYIEEDNDIAIAQLSKLTTNGNSGSNISNTMRTQFIAVGIYLTIGLIVCIALWNNLGPWLICMLAIPIGTIAWVLTGTVLVVARLPYNMVSQGGLIIFLLVFLIFKKKSVFKNFKYFNLFIPLIVLLLSLMYYTTTCHTTTSYDSIKKLQLGFMLAVNNKPYLLFTNVAIYGLIEPFIHSMGYMLGGDYLYVIYPMFYVVILGLLWGGLHRMYSMWKSSSTDINHENLKYFLLMAGLSIGILITNSDYRYAKYYAMSHIIVATYFLVFILFFMLQSDKETELCEWGLFLSSSAIIITRTEGIIYILFLLTLLVGYNSSKKFIKDSYLLCALCVVWTIIQLLMFNGNDGDGYFFSPKKGIILITGSLMTCAYLFLISKGKLEFLVKRNYMLKYLCAMISTIAIVSLKVGEMAITNYEVYIGHLSSFIEGNMNSGYLWGLMLVTVPFLLVSKRKLSDISVGIILGYLGLVFFIFLFRKELPMHEGFGDSGRRMLVHIMPTLVFLVLANMINETVND